MFLLISRAESSLGHYSFVRFGAWTQNTEKINTYDDYIAVSAADIYYSALKSEDIVATDAYG